MIEAIQNIERIWCESVDENPTYKKLLLAPLRFGASLPQKLAQPLSEWFLTSQVKRPTIEDESNVLVNPGHLFPDGSPIIVPFLYFGLCAVPPSALTEDRLYVQSNVGV